jgi:hypothetical protein
MARQSFVQAAMWGAVVLAVTGADSARAAESGSAPGATSAPAPAAPSLSPPPIAQAAPPAVAQPAPPAAPPAAAPSTAPAVVAQAPTAPAEGAPAAGKSNDSGFPPAVSAYAKRGLYEFEGGLSLTYVTVGDESTTIFTLNPAARVFVLDGLAVGLVLQTRLIDDGPTTFSLLPQAEYNLNMNERLFPYVGLGLGWQYAETQNVSSSYFIFQFGGGVKLTFGGGLVGFGVAFPITFSDPLQLGVDVVTRYAVFF